MTARHLQLIASPDAETTSTVVSPVVTGGHWFEATGRPCILRLEVPIAAYEMVAALCGEHERLARGDLADDEAIWLNVALVLVQDGLFKLERLADRLIEQERAGTVVAPDWLAYCRRRTSEVIGEDWASAQYRCPCGYATDTMNAFDAHLEETEGMVPEHFEVQDGWTLEQVWRWHEPEATTGRLDMHGPSAARPRPCGD